MTTDPLFARSLEVELALITPPSSGRLRCAEPMAVHTTFRVGGPADFYLEPSTVDELAAVIRAAGRAGYPVTILGNGSNIVVSDRGIRGVVISLGLPLSAIHRAGDTLIVQAGAQLSSVAAFAAREGLGGMAFASGIPGTIGGAVMMNAGAYDHCMADIVISTSFLDENLHQQVVHGAEHQFGYRNSCFKETERIVTETTVRLAPQDPDSIWAEMAALAVRRRTSQPLELPSAGSAFKRPPGFYAGQLIAECGLKGHRIGGAEVSTKHAGFIVNVDHATATDVAQLFIHVQATVLSETGILLEPEVLFIGDWDGIGLPQIGAHR
jgi:UDP-N-acetylmuramate dehydrogenase